MSNWRIYFQSLTRLKDTTIFTKSRKSTHIMQTVCKLNNHNADIFVHGYKHLAECLSLFVRERLNGKFRDLSYTINQIRNCFTEKLGNLFFSCNRIFNRIMQKSSAEGFHIHMKVSQNNGNFYRMDNKCLA